MWKFRRLFGAAPTVAIPPELADETALLTYLMLAPAELKKIWWYRRGMYHQFEISKKKGKTRLISAPDDRLKHIQRKITVALGQLYRVRAPVHGFVAKRSVKTNALAHLEQRYVLNLDIKDFFPSITERRIYGMLWSIGIDARVAEIIARLCCDARHALPQGAPSSPILSNMICFRLDKHLMRFAKGARCIYTRYADDITFSSYQPLGGLFAESAPPAGRCSPEHLSPALKTIFTSEGFEIHPEKMHYADRRSRRMVTGLKINEFVNVDRRFVRNIRAALHSVKAKGKEAAQETYRAKYGGRSGLVAHLQGKISWLRHIRGQSDPVFRSIAIEFNALFPEKALVVEPTRAETRDRAVWVIEHGDLEGVQGTTFFLRDVGLVTTAHCVTGAKTAIEVFHPSKQAQRYRVTVAHLESHRDLAVLEHSIPENAYYQFEASVRVVATGEEVTAIGFPRFGPADRQNVRSGRITSATRRFGTHLIDVDMKLAQGMSGGPLLDHQDQVIGIIHKGGPEEPRDFAIDIRELNEWLASLPKDAAHPAPAGGA
jgi:RNA-directed DNA polymerase